ncbi:MAG: hypothetical protein AB1705_15675 [Verrucomicrobiota bacterium]
MNSLRHWKIVLILVAIFAAGGVTGSVLTLRGVKSAVNKGALTDAWARGALKVYTTRLQLTPEQAHKLQPVFDQAGKDLKGVRQRAMMDALSVLRVMNEQVEPELQPEQKERLQQMKEEVRARLQDRRKGAPPRPNQVPTDKAI